MRRSPMRRTAFRRAPAPRAQRIERARAPLSPVRIPSPMPQIFRPSPKHVPVRSEALRVAYRALDCQHCGRGGPDAGVCCAHANWSAFGKGLGLKADDSRGASLCSACHFELDQGKNWSGEEKLAIWRAAHERSVDLLVWRRLWPADIPVPDLTEFV